MNDIIDTGFTTIEYARQLDASDPLHAFRDRFYIPKSGSEEAVYFTGNSLGLQPKTAAQFITHELEDWASLGVEGHMHARNPWLSYHEVFPALYRSLLGSKDDEVVVMNQLTVNLHLLLATFYRPAGSRYKIICEAKAFSSDQYALQSRVELHGLDPKDVIIEVSPRTGEYLIRNEDVIETISTHGDSVALVLFGGVNYYTGQFFDLEAITAAAHKAGAYAGFDLAHAVGNVALDLHNWNVDFAAWCSYKYLNSGPGGVSGVFIHNNHSTNTALPRLAGWWGTNKEARFKMEKGFQPIPSAEGWQISNAPVLSMSVHRAALELFEAAGMKNLIFKSRMLKNYLRSLIEEINASAGQQLINIITPESDEESGCQLSLVPAQNGREIFNELSAAGIITDWREPDVIRVAPVPLYNSFTDVWNFANQIKLIYEVTVHKTLNRGTA